MAKTWDQFPTDIARAVERVAQTEALGIIENVFDESYSAIPVASGRLINSGFGYVDTELVYMTEGKTGIPNNNAFGVWEPEYEGEVSTSPYTKHIAIWWHTPKPATPKATVTKIYRGMRVFDYAPKVLGVSGTEHVRKRRFMSRRAAGVGGYFSKRDVTRERLARATSRAIEKRLSLTALRIVQSLLEE